MILSDREIREALRKKKILIPPPPTEEQYTTSALDLILGDEIFELKTPEELAQEEPKGVERPIVIDPLHIDLKNFLGRYAKPLPKEPDGSFILHPEEARPGHYTGIRRTSKEIENCCTC